MATPPDSSGTKRWHSASQSLKTPNSKRHAADYGNTPFKNPLRDNSDFTSPVFSRGFVLGGNDSTPSMKETAHPAVAVPASTTRRHGHAMGQVASPMNGQGQAFDQTQNFNGGLPASNGRAYSGQPQINAQEQSQNFSRAMNAKIASNSSIHMQNPPTDSTLFSSGQTTTHWTRPSEHNANPNFQGGYISDWSYPNETMAQLSVPKELQMPTTVAMSDLQAVQQRSLVPVVSRQEVEALGGKDAYQTVKMSGVDDGSEGGSLCSSARSESATRQEDEGSEGGEDVFVDAEEEVAQPQEEEQLAKGPGQESEDDSDSDETSDDEDYGNGTDEEDDRYMLDEEHRDENAQYDHWNNIAEDMGYRRGEYTYLKGRRGILTGIRPLEPGEKDPWAFSDDSDDDSDSDDSGGGNDGDNDQAGRHEGGKILGEVFDDKEGGNDSEVEDRDEEDQEGSAGGQDSQMTDQDGEENTAEEQAGEDDDANESGETDYDRNGDIEEDDVEKLATELVNDNHKDSEVSNSTTEKKGQPKRQSDVIELSDDDSSEEEPEEEIEMADPDSQDDGKHSRVFKNSSKATKKTPKSKANISNSSTSTTTLDDDIASAAFSGGPIRSLKTTPGIHSTRISRTASPPPKSTSTPKAKPVRRHPDILRDLSSQTKFHAKFHASAFSLIEKLPYSTFNWTRRYWIAVLLPKKNLRKPNFSEKDFIWMKGNRLTSVETVWNSFQTTTMADPDDLALLLGGVEGVGMKERMETLDYFGDKLVVFQAVGKEEAEALEGKSLVDGLVPKGVVEVVDLVGDD